MRASFITYVVLALTTASLASPVPGGGGGGGGGYPHFPSYPAGGDGGNAQTGNSGTANGGSISNTAWGWGGSIYNGGYSGTRTSLPPSH